VFVRGVMSVWGSDGRVMMGCCLGGLMIAKIMVVGNYFHYVSAITPITINHHHHHSNASNNTTPITNKHNHPYIHAAQPQYPISFHSHCD